MKDCCPEDNGGKPAPKLTLHTKALDPRLKKALYRIDNMDCPVEEKLIRDKLGRMTGVAGLEFNLMQRVLTVRHDLPSLAPVEQALAAIGMHAVRADGMPATGEGQSSRAAGEATPPTTGTTRRAPWRALALAGSLALAAEVVGWIPGSSPWVVAGLALASLAVGGLGTYRKGWIALKNRNLNINALMAIAVTGAMLIGHWPEAAMVMALFALAEVIEARSLDRARNAIHGLMALAPDRVTAQGDDGSWVEKDAKAVPVGTLVRVMPGERIALDGVIVRGRSTVNQSPITGESIPVEKGENDPVLAGTINETGSFEYRVTTTASHSTLARIIHAVESAQGSRAPTQRFVDRFARVYTPVVCLLALAVALVPPLLMGAPWLASAYKALVMLVIACPCALVISTPVTVASGLAAAARRGILVKGGAYLEQGHKLAWIALDKTGTITRGKPRLTDFLPWGDADPQAAKRIAASLAARSDHPVSQAVALLAHAEPWDHAEVSDVSAWPGHGVRGHVEGRLFHLGNHRMVEELGACSPALEARLSAWEAQGKTVVSLVGEKGVQAVFAVADTVKDSSRQAIAELHALGVRTKMLTGDNPHTAAAIAAQVGIDQSQGNLLPEDKMREVEALTKHGMTGMVGDGINDAPALARANIGFAMGAAGSDTAIETADVALMDDDLRKIPQFIRLSRDTSRVLTRNIALALGIKAVFLALSLGGEATMWMAVFADMGASLLVVANGLSLLRR